MLNVKQLINSNKNTDNNDYEYNRERGNFIFTILDVLSGKSRDNKQNMIELKKRIRTVLDVNPSEIENLGVFKDCETKFKELLSSDENTEGILNSLHAIEWVKNTGLGKGDVFEEKYEDLDEITKKSKEQFIAVSKRFVKYADGFCSNYEKIGTDYILKNKKIPNYKHILKKVFCNYVGRYIKQSLNNIEFTEENYKEGFGAIQGWLEDRGLDLESSDDIKQHFIKSCREKYPLASKKDDFLFENKSFRQDFIKLITSGLDEYLEGAFDDMEKDCAKNVSKDTEDSELEGNILSKNNRNLLITTNMVVGCISLINRLIDEWAREDNAIGLYFKRIADQFEHDHLKKLEKESAKNSSVQSKTEFSNNEIFVTENVKTGWEVNNLSEKENNLIEEAVSYIDHEKKKSIIKYITKLKIRDLPIKFHDFKRLFNLSEIPPQTESILIDQLGMDYEIEEEELKAEEEISKDNIDKNKDSIKNKVLIPEKINIEDPTQYLIDKLRSLGCIIDNELTAKKQIDEFCQNDNYKTVLINLMTSPKFGKVFLHKPGHKTARTLRIGMTGWRILFTKKKDGNLHFVCFGNHDYYEDSLAKLK